LWGRAQKQAHQQHQQVERLPSCHAQGYDPNDQGHNACPTQLCYTLHDRQLLLLAAELLDTVIGLFRAKSQVSSAGTWAFDSQNLMALQHSITLSFLLCKTDS
jgi:hypothetical protein